jgi:hypothetical protein
MLDGDVGVVDLDLLDDRPPQAARRQDIRLVDAGQLFAAATSQLEGQFHHAPDLVLGVGQSVDDLASGGDKPGDAEKRAVNASKVFIAAGANVTVTGPELKVEGDLGKILMAALQDSDAMYKNDGNYIRTKYGTDDEKKMFRQWHNVFTKFDKTLKKQGKIEEANIVSEVTKKAVETAYNYYGVDAIQVKDKVGLMTFLLVFYVVYTMWWGFSIFFVFEGIGLSMKKAKVKKEV